MKVFKARKIPSKKNKKKTVKLIVFTFFFFFAYVFMIKYLKNNQLEHTILNEEVDYVKFNVQNEGEKVINKIVNSPVKFLNQNVKNAKKIKSEEKTTTNSGTPKKNSSQMVDVKNPIIYIYNTHQTEEYDGYSVYDAANLLSEKLNKDGLYSYFEEQSVKVFLEKNNLKYYKSYEASRKYLNEAKEKNNNLLYFFDIHRDSVSKNISTITHDNKNYAKVLFVVGIDNPGSEKNKDNASKLNEIIKSKVPGISRGIAFHGGKGYNGVYNQDLSENVFLIEVGGKDNTKEEVENTIDIIYESIIEYVRGVI